MRGGRLLVRIGTREGDMYLVVPSRSDVILIAMLSSSGLVGV